MSTEVAQSLPDSSEAADACEEPIMCRHCESNPVEPGEVICEECDQYHTYCTVCRDYIYTEGRLCRHLFWSEDLGAYAGSGASEVDADTCKASVFAVLEKTGLLRPLREALESQQYFMQFYGTIFGWDGVDVYLGTRNYGYRFTENLTDEEEERMSLGVGWLLSLWGGRRFWWINTDEDRFCGVNPTPEAEAITLAWLEEYEHLPPSGHCYYRLEVEDSTLWSRVRYLVATRGEAAVREALQVKHCAPSLYYTVLGAAGYMAAHPEWLPQYAYTDDRTVAQAVQRLACQDKRDGS